jgi:tetratricopeptide (TPR) repeat protein
VEETSCTYVFAGGRGPAVLHSRHTQPDGSGRVAPSTGKAEGLNPLPSALDVLARLSELQIREGKLDQALAVLEQAIKVDPYAEELCRRRMRLLAQLGRGDAARRLLRQLEARLSELDAEPEEETVQLAKVDFRTSPRGFPT